MSILTLLAALLRRTPTSRAPRDPDAAAWWQERPTTLDGEWQPRPLRSSDEA